MSQYVHEGLSFSDNNYNYTANLNSLGVSYLGVLNDGASLQVNPAGLVLGDHKEIQFGLNLYNMGSTRSDLIGSSSLSESNFTKVANMNFIRPYEFKTFKFAIGAGFFKEIIFDQTYTDSGTNIVSSAIHNEASTGFSNYSDNFAASLGLAEPNYPFNTPLNSNLFNTFNLTHEGSINNILFGMAGTISEKISIGFSGGIKFGIIETTLNFQEEDVNNNHNQGSDDWSSINFDLLSINERVSNDVTGFNSEIGMIYSPDENSRISIGFSLPEILFVDRDYDAIDTSYFDDGSINTFRVSTFADYTLISPMHLKIGASYNMNGFVITSGIDLADYSQMYYDSPLPSLEIGLNNDVIDQLGLAAKMGVGINWYMNFLPMVLNASYSYHTSPFSENDDLNPGNNVANLISIGETQILAGSLSFIMSKNLNLNISASYLSQDQDNGIILNDNGYSYYQSTVENTRVMIGFSYKY